MTTIDKTESIKATIARLGAQATPKQIVQALADLGIAVSEAHVSRIKFQMLRIESKAARHRAKPPAKERRKKRPQQRKIPGRQG